MTEAELRRKLLINTSTNYIRMVLRLVLGLLMFRMLYPVEDASGNHIGGLTKVEFGFWALLWSIFGYGILMDFGLGLAAQKKVAELSVHKKWDELSRALSTIIYFYFIAGIVIVIGTLLSSHWLISAIRIDDPAYREPFRRVLVMFLCFIGLSFPTGISIEILYGQHRIALANNLASLGSIANFIVVMFGLKHGWGLMEIMLSAMMAALIPSVIGGWMGLKTLPGVKILPRFFSWSMLRETMGFSLFAYIGLVTQLAMQQTDRLVLGTMMVVSAVAVYQAGAKVADIFWAFTSQMPETVSPAAAHFSAQGDRGALQRLLADSTRFNVMIATPLFIMCACFMEGLLHLLTKGQAIAGQVFWVGQVLLLWCYSIIITHSISKKIFMMCGHEKRLTLLSVIEAVLKLILTVGLVYYFKNVVVVAIGSLIPSLIIGWCYFWPWSAKDAGVNGWQLAGHVLFRNWRACLPLLAFALFCRALPVLAQWLVPSIGPATLHWLDFRDNVVLFVIEGTIAGLLAVGGVWQWALKSTEREKISAKLGKFTARFARATPA
jgi:O-antigen/teichoic acid export membrane protein